MRRKKKLLKMVSLLTAFVLIFTTVLPAYAANQPSKKVKETRNGCSDDPNAYAIYPIPQSISYAPEGEFTLNSEAVIVKGAGVDDYTIDFLKEVLGAYHITAVIADTVQSGKTNIVLSVNGDSDAAATYATGNATISDTKLFEKPDAYMLDAKDNTFIIRGKDADSVYYGVATLQMMFSSFAGEKFLNAHIEDYASIATRGYIEGFYGEWTFEERAELMEFAKNYKMNSYVYAAKGDAYHTSKWAELYPPEKLAQLKNLVQVGEKTKVKFAWSIHLGSFFGGIASNWDATNDAWLNEAAYNTQYDKLIAKLTQLYDIGVRRLDILNDDFGGGDNEMVVTVLNRLNQDLTAKGCEPITYCPQGYNQAWSGNGAELAALRNLDADINIYWTGADVNSPITQDTVDFLRERANHDPDFWLNYPVNEHAKSGIYLGDITHYSRDNVTGLAGFHSNPSRFAYANEVGLYQLAALVWNNNNYGAHAQEVWESAFDYLQPEVRDSYFTIASNVSNCPGSGRVPQGFPESEYLKETLAVVQNAMDAGDNIKALSETQKLMDEFQTMVDAVADFRANCANKSLIAELEPWLKSLDDLAHAGVAALESLIALEDNDVAEAWNQLSSASKYYDSMYTYLTTPDIADVYAKAGSKRLAPLVASAIRAAKGRITPILNPNDDTVNPVLYARIGGVERMEDANTKQIYDGNDTTYGGWQVAQQKGDYYGLDLGRVITVKDITILQGQDATHHDVFHNATLQYSENGDEWTDIQAAVEGNTVSADGLNVKARYVRYYLNETGFNGKPDYWTFVREFTVNKKVAETDRIYTNINSLKATPLTLAGAEISVRGLKSVQLAKGEYVGIRLANVSNVTAFVKNITDTTGLTFEYSYNETKWTTVPETLSDSVGVKYVRLINKTDATITTDINKIGMVLGNTTANMSVLENNLTSALKEGSFENMFDGDLSTYAWTNEPQTTGQYITVDLGSNMQVYDVQVVTDDGNPRFYNADIQISSDNKTWTNVAQVVEDNSVFEVPYRYVRGNAQGKNARYLRIYLTGNKGYYLKIHEIEINKTIEKNHTTDKIVSNLEGNPGNAADNDISTLFTTTVDAGSYIEYRIDENTNVDQVAIVQGTAGKGNVYAITPDGRKLLGTLDETVKRFDTSAYDVITAIRMEWDEAEEISIHEIYLTKGAYGTDDVGTATDPIIDEGTEEPDEPKVPTNLAPGKAVEVSGSETEGTKQNVNDENPDTKWDSNYIEKGTSRPGETSWVYIDLGTEKQYEISSIIVRYFNAIWPTDYVVQVAPENTTEITADTEWITRETITDRTNGTANQIDEFVFDTPVNTRFVRLYFTKLNPNAFGNGVGIKEFEIYGVEADSIDTSVLEAAMEEAGTKSESTDYTVATKKALKSAVTAAQAVLDTANTQDVIDDAVTVLRAAIDALQVKISAQQNIGLKKPVMVSGTSNGVKESINDEDINSKWDSDLIKGPNKESDEAWFVIDLGEQKNLIDQLNVKYFNKVYPTQYEVQISNDNTNWTTVKTLTRDHDGPTYPLDEIRFDTPVSGRYVKMLFTEMNSAAGGHGIGITNAEILGRYVYESAKVTSVSTLQDITVTQGEAFDASVLPDTMDIQIAVEELANPMAVTVPLTWNVTVDAQTPAGTYTLTGTLGLSGIANPDNRKASVNVIVESHALVFDYEALDTQLAIAEEKVKDQAVYTPNSYAVFEAAYHAAKAAKTNATTQAAIDEAANTLQTAIGGLIEKTDTAALANKLEKLKEIQSEKEQYFADKIAGLDELIIAIEDLIADGNATEAEISDAIAQADEMLKPENKKADKTALLEAIEKALKVDLSKYTEASVKALTEALTAANVLKDNEELSKADQSRIDDAVTALNSAFGKLETKPSETPDPDNGNGEGGSTSDSEHENHGAAQTGDSSNMGMWSIAAAIAMTAVIAMLDKKRKTDR